MRTSEVEEFFFITGLVRVRVGNRASRMLSVSVTSVHEIRAGTLYAMNNHDRHRIRAKTRMHVICTFFPALSGEEVHDTDGSL